MSIYLDPSFSSSLTQYAGGSVSLETLVWQRFVAAYDIDVSQPITDDEQTQFRTLLELYESIGLTPSSLSGTATPPTTSNYTTCYEQIYNSSYLSWAFRGSAQGVQDIWNGFLQAYNIDNNRVSSIDFSALFSTYIKALEQKAAGYTPSVTDAQVSPEQDLQIVLWNRFLTIYGYSPTQQSTPALRSQFSSFLQQYELWGIDLSVLNSTNTLPSGGGSDFFVNSLRSFYGQYGDPELTDLWNKFLQTQGLTSNPTDLTSLQQPFLGFLQGFMAKKASFEAATGLSPANQQQRNLFSSIMNSLANMLTVTEQVVVTNATALEIYGAWQEQLTQEMTRTPNLVPIADADMSSSELTTVRIPLGDPLSGLTETDAQKLDFFKVLFSKGYVTSSSATIPDTIPGYTPTAYDQALFQNYCTAIKANADITDPAIQLQYGLTDLYTGISALLSANSMSASTLFNGSNTSNAILASAGLINTNNAPAFTSYSISVYQNIYTQAQTIITSNPDTDPRTATTMAEVAVNASPPAALSTVTWADFLSGQVEGTGSVSIPSSLGQIISSINLVGGSNPVDHTEAFYSMWADLAARGACDPDPSNATKWDLDRFTLGYNKTTIKEVIQWAYSQLRNGSSTSVTFTAGGTYTFALVKNTDGSTSIQVTIIGPANDTSSASIKYTNADGQNMLSDGSGTTDLPDTFDNWVAAIGKTFCQAIAPLTASIVMYQGTTDSENNTTYVTGLKGHYTEDSTPYTDPKTKTEALDTTPTQNRLEQNAVLQQYIAKTRAKRSVVQNASSIIQTTLQTAQSSINKIASLWTSILQAIATILHSLYHSSS